MYLIYDTETTGLPKDFRAPISDSDNWPRVVQIAWQLHDEFGNLIEHKNFLIKPENFTIPYSAEQIHGISTQLATEKGKKLDAVLDAFNTALKKADFIVGHNIEFDRNIMGAEFFRKTKPTPLMEMPKLDTNTEATANLCQLPGGRGGRYKLPKLGELYNFLFQESFSEAHNATADVEATARAFFELIRRGIFSESELYREIGYLKKFQNKNPEICAGIGLKHVNLKRWSAELKQKTETKKNKSVDIEHFTPDDSYFAHLHNHTQYSVLQSNTKIKKLIEKVAAYHMNAVAITDLNNMMGVYNFVEGILSYNKRKDESEQIKPIVGVELNVVDDHTDKTKKDNGYATVFLAKNKAGYHNLIKLVSIAHTEGYYYIPRIGRESVQKYKDNLIVLSGGLNGEIANKILSLGEHQAEDALLWWKENFGNDFYLEIMRHNQDDEDHVNETLIDFSKKHQIKLIATNNTFYLDKEDAEAQDILLCIKENEKKSTPIGRGKGYRFGLPNDEYYFKSPDEMKELFKDLPEAVSNIQEIVDKIETFGLKRDVLLPKFDIPEEFINLLDEKDGGKRGENAYLKYLTYEGAKKRWKEITPEIKERLDFELEIIEKTKYPGYFLIVQDIIKEARKMGVMVGPGRGSAAGSAVAYCLKITNLDPIHYNLLFERFLNPERVSLPDIDMDFDDEGREKVIEYVIDKYGKERVAQIITYGTMAAKSSIRDAGRVTEFPLHETDKLAKKAHVSLDLIINKDEEKIKSKAKKPEIIQDVMNLAEIAGGDDASAKTIRMAAKLEGSLRNIGLHACGFIIAPTELSNVIPVTTAKGSDMFVTQYDNGVVEDAGLLKMDFLGIKTLTIIRDAIRFIKEKRNIDVDIDNLPLDDEKTYQLYQKGQTITVFQFESDGMRKHLMALKPTKFEDIIAMVALYRPGPMEKIPSYIRRKYGQEEVTYDLPEMEENLKNTYGITIYQEQVMLLSQKLANFTKGEADNLRKAMGKKKHDLLAEMKPLFIKNGQENGHPKDILEKIWEDWKSFASYAFNRSHAVSYALVAYQTAYLKANYPSEYMAAVLSHNLKDAKKLSFLMDETRKMGIEVLPPDINESSYLYTVNNKGNIRYGLGGASGVGEIAVNSIIAEREKNGDFIGFFDFIKRVDLRSVNKKTIETLVYAGAFDSFKDTHRAQYFQTDEKGVTFIEKAIKFGNNFKKNQASMQTSLFGDSSDVQIPEPKIPQCEPWTELQKLEKEKDVTGIYLSGHPLDTKRNEFKYYVKKNIHFINEMIQTLSGNKEEQTEIEGDELLDSDEENAQIELKKRQYAQLLNKEITIGGMVVRTNSFETRNGKVKGELSIEDYSDSLKLDFWNEDFLKYKHLFVPKTFLLVKISISRNYYNPSQLRIKVIDMILLQDVFKKLPKNLSLFFLSDVKQHNIDRILNILSYFKGKQKLIINILDNDDPALNISAVSKKLSVKMDSNLINKLEEINVKFSLT